MDVIKGSRIVRFDVKRNCRWLSVVLIGFAVTGCSSQMSSYKAKAPATPPANLLSEDIAAFLQSTEAGSRQAFDQSPWGEQVTVVADESYASATGSECRPLTILKPDSDSRALACSKNGADWYSVRVLSASK
ncbi:DVU3141 family protein [Neptunomonas concharum]|uniref:Uncharacterized protein n=1 Tax=Neptunomonas concharum TaxID=1031538 RepID=A0A5P1R8G6_9GAMM|nr:DVU3141 family protein [Neptunomonas concharum]QEQ95863.1 hypothetical protein F0U83_03610 [Neptunomonas concharum]